MTTPVAQPGPLGGADNELGGEFRARLAAYVATYGLRGIAVRLSGDENCTGVPAVVRCEVDEPVDDIEVRFVDKRRVLIQVKRHLDNDLRPGRPFAKVVDQWIEQCSANTSDKTPLVAVAQSASESARHLAAALDARRDQHAGALTGAQRDALKRLTDALATQPDSLVADILSRASLRILNLDAGYGEAAVAEGLLDGYVVKAGQGGAAFDLLAAAHRERAARRSGLDLDGWIKALERGHLGLLADPGGSRAARRSAELAALGRYCERLTQSSRTIDLLALGVELPPLEAIELTEVTHDPPGAGNQRSVDLDLALRRHGRVLLLGAPDSGKSTMLRWLAGREAERRWSKPALIDLRTLVQLKNGSLTAFLDVGPDPVDTLVDLALAGAPYEDRDMLAAILRAAAADGSMLVCLDSLDETREHRHAVLA